MEKKGGWRASSNNSNRETMALLGLCIPTEGDYYWIIDLQREMEGT